MSVQQPYAEQTYYGLALDPIHVGTGGYRLGEVDLTIVREPGTNLPKIPGSSLAGAARAYTAMRLGRYRVEDTRPKFNAEQQSIEQTQAHEEPPVPTYVSCAGKGGEDGSGHCGAIDCPVCVTYGFTIGPQNRSFHGLAQFYDAHILLFPVHTMVGPVWVTCASALADAGVALPDSQQVSGEEVRVTASLHSGVAGGDRLAGLNLGWLYLAVAESDLDVAWGDLGLPDELAQMGKRLVVLSDNLFGIVVDSNLEVRTSVAINPATGAADPGALFTYEAIPRSAVLRFAIVYHNPQHYVFPALDSERHVRPTAFPTEQNIDWLKTNVMAGLELMQYLGVGGMATRGFGRLRVWPRSGQGSAI